MAVAEQAATGERGENARTAANHQSLTMREFFKPRRRKLGVVTLVIACSALTAWLRSQIILDVVSLDGNSANIGIVSIGNAICLLTDGGMNPDEDGFKLLWKLPEWQARAVKEDLDTLLQPYDIQWRCRCFGFSHGQYIIRDSWRDVWTVPYWSLALPLTLLSAWLLLVKPRASKLTTTTEPPPTTGT